MTKTEPYSYKFTEDDQRKNYKILDVKNQAFKLKNYFSIKFIYSLKFIHYNITAGKKLL